MNFWYENLAHAKEVNSLTLNPAKKCCATDMLAKQILLKYSASMNGDDLVEGEILVAVWMDYDMFMLEHFLTPESLEKLIANIVHTAVEMKFLSTLELVHPTN